MPTNIPLMLQLKENLREEIPYTCHAIPLCTCIDHFDDYAQRQWTLHWHDEYEFMLVLEGSAEITVHTYSGEPASVLLKQGDGILIASGMLHSAKAPEAGTVTAGFTFTDALLSVHAFDRMLHEMNRPIRDYRISHLELRSSDDRCREILSVMDSLRRLDMQDLGYEMHCIELIFRLWRLTMEYAAGLCKAAPRNAADAKEQLLSEILSYIHAHYDEHITVDDMARYAGISRTEVFRCFSRFLGKTPVEYLTDYRLSMAGMLLTNTDHSLSDIICACGFNSPSYFGKLFKERHGISPGKYRQRK